MHKVVYNACYGGYGISEQGAEWLLANGASPEKVRIHHDEWGYVACDLERHDPLLVRMVEELGEQANGSHAQLRVLTMEQPLYRIREYDGSESVEEPRHIRWSDSSKLEA